MRERENMADLRDEYESISNLPPHISSVGHGGGSVGDCNLMSGPGTGVISGSEIAPASRLHDIGIATGTESFGSSSSSSSSEDDDGQGRRRKKGLRQKIKEKLGGEKQEETTTSGLGVVHEKKSMMEKIKDKLPGHHAH